MIESVAFNQEELVAHTIYSAVASLNDMIADATSAGLRVDLRLDRLQRINKSDRPHLTVSVFKFLDGRGSNG